MNQGAGTVKMNPTAVKGQMKGLLKGLRYISQMFDEEDQEKEIQIGFPTDVKHLAHIGCEDAKATAPSWMTEFKEPQEQPGANAKISESQDTGNNSDNNNPKGDVKKSHVRRARQRSTDSTQSTPDSPQREEKPSRRHHSSETSRRNKSNEEEENKPPKQSHRRKPKTTSEEKDKDSSNRRRTRRSSKAGSLTDASFTDLGSGSASGPLAQ